MERHNSQWCSMIWCMIRIGSGFMGCHSCPGPILAFQEPLCAACASLGARRVHQLKALRQWKWQGLESMKSSIIIYNYGWKGSTIGSIGLKNTGTKQHVFVFLCFQYIIMGVLGEFNNIYVVGVLRYEKLICSNDVSTIFLYLLKAFS